MEKIIEEIPLRQFMRTTEDKINELLVNFEEKTGKEVVRVQLFRGKSISTLLWVQEEGEQS